MGLAELRLIARSGFCAFPPRLLHQPFFYPVCTREYAEKIARDWNTVDEASGYAGFVTEFEVADEHVQSYPIRDAGGSAHQELWVPAEELDHFNAGIVGAIRVVASFVGARCSTEIDAQRHLPVDLLDP